jgi:hypothetical protein
MWSPPLASPYKPNLFIQLWLHIKRYFIAYTDRDVYTIIGDDYSEDEDD